MAGRGLCVLVLCFCVLVAECKKKDEAIIEDVTAKKLDKLIEEKDYVAVFWYARNCRTCDKVLLELEKIDDDTDNFGVDFVKINDKRLAKQYGIKSFPALSYFRNKEPINYDGDLMDEDGVLEFLTSLDAMELPDQIEEVNAKILEKIVLENDFVAVLFCPDEETCAAGKHKAQCRKCDKALKELENIDDEADKLEIAMVKIQDEDLAEEYSLTNNLPCLVYYRKQIPIVYDGDLTKEEEVLEWLVQNMSTGDDEDVIEEVSLKALETLITSVDNLAVLFYEKDEADSLEALENLENIDDECDQHGIQFVKIDDDDAEKEFGIDHVPTLVYFENEIPNLYDGDLANEETVLAWLIEQYKTDQIEDVTDEMLDRLIKDSKHLAVLFYDEDEKDSRTAVTELENIDDDCDKHGIAFVKIDNDDEAKEYGIDDTPALVYFEHGIPSLYDGDLTKEEEVLEWLLHQVASDEIEEITDEMLDMLLANQSHVAALFSRHHDLAVLFYNKNQKRSIKVLAELENIDDDCDEKGIVFVKLDNEAEAKEYGIESFPSLIYFENGIPHLYDGDLMNEDEVLQWLVDQIEQDIIEDVTDEMLDKLIKIRPYVAALFYDKDSKTDMKIVAELENIDDDLDEHGIVFVRIDNDEELKEYGLDETPTLVYFENKIPNIYEGDLSKEQEVLKWLVDQKKDDTIEEVTDEILEKLIEEHEYVAVYFSDDCEEGEPCDDILDELENIDDETDDHGIILVTTEDVQLAKKHGVKSFPKLVFFRNKEPLVYEGDLTDEDEVLAWLTDDDTLEIPDKIEEVNRKMLAKILEAEENVVVFFYEEESKKADRILAELENIDDECEESGVEFVKISDYNIEKDYDLPSLPALVFFRNSHPEIYTGDLTDEDAVLDWVTDLKDSPIDIIEEVDASTVNKLLKDMDYLVVFFYDDDCSNCETILTELEKIDDDTDKEGIHFVKTKDTSLAKKFGIDEFPSLVYFEDEVPNIYEGDLEEEEVILKWIVDQKNDDDDDDHDVDIPKRGQCTYIAFSAEKSSKLEQYRCCPTGHQAHVSSGASKTQKAKSSKVTTIGGAKSGKPKKAAVKEVEQDVKPKKSTLKILPPPVKKPTTKKPAATSTGSKQAAAKGSKKPEKEKEEGEKKWGFFSWK